MNDLRKLRTSRQLPAREMVAVVQGIYPKYDKTMQSKCERGNEYGIELKQDAMTALLTKFAPEKLTEVTQETPPTEVATRFQENCNLVATKKKPDGHRLTCRISCRLEGEEYNALKEIIKEEGFDTTQEWLASNIRAFIKNKSKGAKPL